MPTLALTWGLVMIGLGFSCMLYGISCAQVFLYYQLYSKDRLSIRLLTAMVWILNTIHLGLAMHIPWYYLVDGAGGTHNDVVVWSWPASIIVTVLITLPVYAFFIHRIHMLGGALWHCVVVGLLACAHCSLTLKCSISALLDSSAIDLIKPSNATLVSIGFAVGTATDVGIAALMCWRLLASRTGHSRDDSMIWTLISYTLNAGVLTAVCVVAGLVASITAKDTQFELFFLLILPELYVNSFLGSLNAREVHLAQRDWFASAHSRTLGQSRRHSGVADGSAVASMRTPIVRVEHATVSHTDGALPSDKLDLDSERADLDRPSILDLARARSKVHHYQPYAG